MKSNQNMAVLRKISIKYRLLFAFLITSIIPLIIICVFSFKLYSKSLEDKISTSTTKMLSLVNVNMITELEKYQYLCGSICINETIQDALNMDTMTSGEKNRIILDIQDIISTQIIYPAQAKNITVYNASGDMFYNLGYDGFYENDVEFILKDIVDKTSNDSWNYVRTYRSRDIIVLGRKILDRYDLSKLLGFTLISIDEKLFSKTVLTPVNMEEGSNILCMKPDGTILSSWDRSVMLGVPFQNEKLIDQLQKEYPKKSGFFAMDIEGDSQLINYSYNKNVDLYFVSIIPFSYINSETYVVVQQLLMIALPLLLFCISITLVIYFSIANPISKMVSDCHEISDGNFDERLNDMNKDELSYLSNSLDNMVDKIQNLLYAQKADESKKRELELQMLQYQINPHFLFNTLNSLRFVASMNQDMVVSEGIVALANLLKNVLVNKREFITIREEVENLKNYFSIQNIRYAGNFQVSYDLDETLLSCVVPKLILQPLAENSIMHGTTDNGFIMDIHVRCYREEDYLVLEISDKGKGFDPQVTKSKGIGGIGISNVDDRIHLNFGDTYGLYITSAVGKGTVCKITLPELQLTPDALEIDYHKETKKGFDSNV